MSSQALVSDTFSLSGERLRQALKVAGHQARVAQISGYGRHVEAEAEESGEAERVRRDYFPRYQAA